MAWVHTCKLFQKQLLDVLSQRNGTLVLIAFVVLIFVSVIQFGEVWMEWSQEKYEAVFNSFSDNLVSKSFQNRLCLPVPIDVVYTWVNGTDPKLLHDLNVYRQAIETPNSAITPLCAYDYCTPVYKVIVSPPIPSHFTLSALSVLYPAMAAAESLLHMPVGTTDINVTVITFSTQLQVDAVIHGGIMIAGENATLKQGYLTTDGNVAGSISLSQQFFLTNIADNTTEYEVESTFQQQYHVTLEKVEFLLDEKLAILNIADLSDVQQLIDVDNVTIGEQIAFVKSVHLVWNFTESLLHQDIAANRFEDNEELRYSMRSVERFAPWVRHVYLVTNGQIPYWLNLDAPKLTLITHEELFQNSSDLPSFSSPAIESHLHRIPGLSEKFIYLNDDVMFGKEVWPDDFYTHSDGQKIYLAWAMPNCQDGCPSTWIKDGYCDKACNNSECEWDGGDCDGVAHAFGWAGDTGGGWQQNTADYCTEGCAVNWVADRYCDQSCNVAQCGYDAGDCGLERFQELYSVNLDKGEEHYYVAGENVFYLNASSIFPNDAELSDGFYEQPENKIIKAMVLAQKYKIVTLILKTRFNYTDVELGLFGKLEEGNSTSQLSYNLTLHISPEKSNVKLQPLDLEDSNVEGQNVSFPKLYPDFEFDNVQEAIRHPQQSSTHTGEQPELPAIDGYVIPLNIHEKYEEIHEKLKNGDLTQKGFNKQHKQLWDEFKFQLDGKTPEKLQLNSNDTIGGNQTHKTRTLKMVGIDNNQGFLPWEKQQMFSHLLKLQPITDNAYAIDTRTSGRHLLDTYANSMRYVNKLYNAEYGFTARKVPAHTPHMIDTRIMTELQEKFPAEWQITSSHRVRHSEDMQYAFSYYYYLISEKVTKTAAHVFNDMDVDNSGVLSDRELRTFATRLYEAPLNLQALTNMETSLTECAQNISAQNYTKTVINDYNREEYYDKNMPQVTVEVMESCENIVKLMKEKFKDTTKYKHEVMDDNDLAFKMIRTNVSHVVGQLDDIRRNPRKFICLNDNIDHSKEHAQTVKAVVQDFYEALFPIPSNFELARDYRNRFLHIKELREWRKYRDWLRIWTQIALVVLVVFTLCSFLSEKLDRLQRRWFPNMSTSQDHSEGDRDPGLSSVKVV